MCLCTNVFMYVQSQVRSTKCTQSTTAHVLYCTSRFPLLYNSTTSMFMGVYILIMKLFQCSATLHTCNTLCTKRRRRGRRVRLHGWLRGATGTWRLLAIYCLRTYSPLHVCGPCWGCSHALVRSCQSSKSCLCLTVTSGATCCCCHPVTTHAMPAVAAATAAATLLAPTVC